MSGPQVAASSASCRGSECPARLPCPGGRPARPYGPRPAARSVRGRQCERARPTRGSAFRRTPSRSHGLHHIQDGTVRHIVRRMSHRATEGHRPPERYAADRRVDGLLVRVAQGDQTSFAGVYDALVVPVMGMASRILRDEAQAEEVTQDVMIECGGQPPGSVRSAAPRSRGSSRWPTGERWNGCGPCRPVRTVNGEPRAAPPDPVRRSGGGRRGAGATGPGVPLLAGLGKCERLPLVLAYYQGLTYAEVAEALSTPPGTVKTRMRTGLQKLRACLGSG